MSVGKGINYQLLPSTSSEADSPTLTRPPDYHTIVDEHYTPSAPPPSADNTDGTHSVPTHGSHQPTVSNTETNTATTNGFYKLIHSYATYSISQNLRKLMKRGQENLEDPELDVNAHFASRVVENTQRHIKNKKRLQCCSSVLWCIGLLQVLVYITLPIAMLVTGIAGINSCPYRSITIIIYLITGGSLSIILVFSRTVPSLLTCYKNKKTRDSKLMTGCICASEISFFVLLVPNLVILVLGSYWIFDETPKDCNGTVTVNCCETYVFTAGAIYNILQYVVYTVSVVYVVSSVLCLHCVKGRQNRQEASSL